VTLGLVLNGNGFPRRSQIFPGNVSEPKMLQAMLAGLQALPAATVVLGCGVGDRRQHWLA
jgi:hypothetical protein